MEPGDLADGMVSPSVRHQLLGWQGLAVAERTGYFPFVAVSEAVPGIGLSCFSDVTDRHGVRRKIIVGERGASAP